MRLVTYLQSRNFLKHHEIRLATPDDLQFTDEVFAAARERMRAEGNTQQWVNGYPSHEVILRDISRGEGYIIEAQGCVSGYFCLQHGLEPTYAQIRGEWPSEGPYLTIHRAAARIAGLHIFPAIISFASRYGLTLRADTHAQTRQCKGCCSGMVLDIAAR